MYSKYNQYSTTTSQNSYFKNPHICFTHYPSCTKLASVVPTTVCTQKGGKTYLKVFLSSYYSRKSTNINVPWQNMIRILVNQLTRNMEVFPYLNFTIINYNVVYPNCVKCSRHMECTQILCQLLKLGHCCKNISRLILSLFTHLVWICQNSAAGLFI